MKQEFLDKLKAIFGLAVLVDEPMSLHTTLRIGGSADVFVTAKTRDELLQGATLARQFRVPVFILGMGSNILVGDRGIRGLVIYNKSQSFEIIQGEAPKPQKTTEPRLIQRKEDAMFWYDDLDYDESAFSRSLVRVDSGYPLPKLISDLIEAGITGLEWFGGIPGTVGGGIYNNIHGADRFLGDFLVSARMLNLDNRVQTVSRDYFLFAYDYSAMQQNKDVLLDVTFTLALGDAAVARQILGEWIKRKASWHPGRSSGCVFQNLPAELALKLGFTTNSAGYMIDQKLGLKGKQIGGAEVSVKHANFIVNRSKAKASDVVKLIRLIKQKADEKYGILLKEEIFYVGDF